MSPRRTCVGCRSSLHPDDGVRVTADADGVLVVSRTAPGRGAWLCRATAGACAADAAKRRAWGRALRREVAAEQARALAARLAVPDGVGAGPQQR